MENLENIGLDCPCYDFGDCSTPTFDIGEFFPIGANNGKLTITVNGEVVAEFYADQSEDTTANIDLSGYTTSEDLEEAKQELEAKIDDKASISELEDEADIREEENNRLSDEIDQLGEELNSEVNARTQADIALGNRIDLKADITALTAETTNRENADIELQSQIDAITSQSDVVDIVGTYAELQAYDTSSLGDNDIVKVLTDSTHDNAPSYFRWNKTAQTWSYVGSESVAYTKAEADDRFVPKTRTINNKALSENITLTTNDLANDSGYLTEADLTDYVKNTDYSTATKAGVVRDANCFLTSDTNGGAYAEEMTYATYANASDYNFVGKGTLENVLNGRKYLMPEFVQELPATGADNKLYLTPAEEQPDVEKNVSGKEIEITDASEGDLIDWQLKGDTEQASYTGSNLLDPYGRYTSGTTTTLGGVTVTFNDDQSFTFNGKMTSNNVEFLGNNNNQQIVVDGSKTYSAEIEVIGGNISVIGDGQFAYECRYNNGQGVYYRASRITGARQTIMLDTSNTEYITRVRFYANVTGNPANAPIFNNFRIKVTIHEQDKPSLEPFVGGTASPNPDYPQEVKTVTGRNTVSVVGKNLYDSVKYPFVTNVAYNASGKVNWAGYSGIEEYLPVEPNTTYTFSNANNYKIHYGLQYNDTNKQQISVVTNDVTTFTTPANCYFIRFAVQHSDAPTNVQLEKGSSKTSYQPYSGQEVEVNLGKNLFYLYELSQATLDGLTFTPNSDNTLTITGTSTRTSGNTLYMLNNSDSAWKYSESEYHFKAGTYTISSNVDGDWNNGLGITAYKKDGTRIMFGDSGIDTDYAYRNHPITFTSDQDFSLTLRFVVSYGKSWNSTVGFQIERGDKATSYAEYFEPIELCKLGDYQDRIYKDGGTWKIEKKVGKAVINSLNAGSAYGINTALANTTRVLINQCLPSVPSNSIDARLACLSNNFVNKITPTGGSNWGQDIEGFFIDSNDAGTLQGVVFRGLKSTIGTTDTDVETWLNANSPKFYYVLYTPTTTTITYQPLIDQLNELETLTTQKGYNAVSTDTPTVQPFLDFTYFRPDPTVTKDEWLWIENHYEQLGGERRYTHNMSVNHNTAQGHWDYVFTIVGKEASHYTQLAQVAYYLFREHAGLTIPVSGTYTEGNDVYILTKITASSLSQVTIEMRKLSDGSVRNISTGAVPVQDTIS